MDITLCVIPNLASDEIGYKIGVDNYAAVRLTPSAGAAASMVGITAIAFAVTDTGLPVLGPTGDTYEAHHTSSSSKVDLLLPSGKVDPDKVRTLKQEASQGALEAMMGLIGADSIMGII